MIFLYFGKRENQQNKDGFQRRRLIADCPNDKQLVQTFSERGLVLKKINKVKILAGSVNDRTIDLKATLAR